MFGSPQRLLNRLIVTFITNSPLGPLMNIFMNISQNMDDRKRQGKSTKNVGLVSKVEPLKQISCGHCGKPDHIITNCWKLGRKTHCEHCGKFNHKSEDCRIAKNELHKKLNPQG